MIADSNREAAGHRETGREEAALRRIATLVAEGVQPHELFAVVAEEVARVVDAPSVDLVRYEGDGMATVCGSFPPQEPLSGTGTRIPLEGASVLRLVREHAEPARVDTDAELRGEISDAIRRSGMCSSVGVPIVVSGSAWGAIVASKAERLPENTGIRLAEFTELVAAAIANTEARQTLAQLADEQAALRRVATLVAQNVAQAEIFAAVSAEVDRVFRLDPATCDVAVVGRFEAGPELVVVGVSKSVEAVPFGSRWPPDDLFAPAHVLRTGRSARIGEGNLDSAGGEVADFLRRHGYLSQVASPIVVDGRLWGAMSVNARNDFSADTEERLERFTELIATAIASAESRGMLSQLANEQAALSRVATLVAKEDVPEKVFAMVAEETGRLLGGVECTLLRNERDGAATNVGTWGETISAVFPLKARFFPDGDGVAATVLRTGRPHRIDDYLAVADPLARSARERGIESSVGCPVVVRGAIWGAILVGTTGAEPFPPETETRLTQFADLVATAVANAESRGEIVRLADEQAALRRVATLVAEEVPPARIFEAVCEQVERLLGADVTALEFFAGDGTATLIAVCSREGPSLPVGKQIPLEPDTIAARIVSTHAPARREGHHDAHAKAGPFARDLQLQLESTVGAPILVGGRLWGALMAGTTSEAPWAAEAETRLSGFAELVATAIANAESRAEVARLAEEQATLRRLAMLIAQEAALEAVFAQVAEDVTRTLGDVDSALWRDDGDRTLSAVAVRGPSDARGVRVGTRLTLDGDSVIARVLREGRPQRIDDFSELAGSVAERARRLGTRSAIGCPIVVGSRMWGVMTVATYGADPFAPETETRVARFGELVATAIANAESRDALARLAEEQAALRHVATLVARDAPPGEVFAAVAMEVGKLLDADTTVVGRYDADGVATAIGSWSSSPDGVPVGTRSVLGGRNVLTLVAETKRPARVDGYGDGSGEAAEIARRHGWRSSIAAPIIVEGRLWGVMLVATQRSDPFPGGAEERLSAFTDLVATALANAQARDELRRFGEEQAALGRVASLVAAGAAPEQVFTAVVDEAASLLGLERIEFVRYDGSNTATVIAASGEHPFPAGSTWSLDHPSVMATVARTKCGARIDDYGTLEGEIARAARIAGFQSAIGAPLTVEGHLWGVIIAISTDPEPIPERSEARLGQFTGLVATAVANAEARQALEGVAAEQATLRRIATLVARGVQPSDLFAAVAEETAAAFDAITAVMRFEHDPPGVTLVGVSRETRLPVGTRWDFAEGMASTEVYRTGRSARLSSGADYWSSRSGPVAEAGRRLGIVSQVSCPIVVEGGVWGVITVNAGEDLPPDTEQRLEKFTDLVTTAIANAQGKSELAASRRRIVAAADEARRLIERDLHDGIQQRLIALSFRARAMTRRPSDELEDIATELSEGLKDVSDELREVSRGIHPTILTEAGLGPALRALARRSTVPTEVDVRLDGRLPSPVETAAYYIASEALTNVAKHAQANVVHLIASHYDRILTLEVRDDGVGGVDAGRGSGILGLTDRVDALGGTISIASPPRGGTALCVRLPTTQADGSFEPRRATEGTRGLERP